MKHLIATTLFLGAVSHAMAQSSTIANYNKLPDNVYLSGTIGISRPNDSEITKEDGNSVGISNTLDIDDRERFSVAVGKHSYPWRFEIEFSQHHDHDARLIAPSISFNVRGVEFSSFMVNAFRDWYLDGGEGNTALYIGMGVGASEIKLDYNYSDPSLGTFTGEVDDVVVAYQFMLGLSRKITEPVTLTGGYRLWVSDKPTFEGTTFDHFVVHIFEMGVRFDF